MSILDGFDVVEVPRTFSIAEVRVLKNKLSFNVSAACIAAMREDDAKRDEVFHCGQYWGEEAQNHWSWEQSARNTN